MDRYDNLKRKRNLTDFYKNEPNESIWWIDDIDGIGEYMFSFDKETIFSFFTDYPQKLTAEQIEIFKKENPILAALK